MLYLASQSPRRRALLAQLGVPFQVLDAPVDEIRAAHESPADYVSRVARDKARAGLAALAGSTAAVVLGADTEVVLDGEVFGKPADAAQAARMLRQLSGRVHEVLTCVWLVADRGEERAFSRSEVSFASLGDDDIHAYLASGEWQGKAGGYAIQGTAGAWVAHLSGSHSGVMGLPLHPTWQLLRHWQLLR